MGINAAPDAPEDPRGEVRCVATLWSAVESHPSGKEMSGFAGRVFLLAGEGFRPIQARGRMVIYAFSDSKAGLSRAAADKRWEFSSEELPKHVEETMLGWSYVFWVPWDRDPTKAQTVNLQVAFVPEEDGSEKTPVVGPPVRLVLPEPDDRREQTANTDSNRARDIASSRGPNVKTHTIELNPRVGGPLPVIQGLAGRSESFRTMQPQAGSLQRTVKSSGEDTGSGSGEDGGPLFSGARFDNAQRVANGRNTRFQASDRFRQKPLMFRRNAPFQNDRRAFLPNVDGRQAEGPRIGHARRQTGGHAAGLPEGNGESDPVAGLK